MTARFAVRVHPGARRETSRSKQIEIEGIETAELKRRIERALEEANHRGE